MGVQPDRPPLSAQRGTGAAGLLRTRERHVRRAWELLQEEAGSLGA